ncbi:uncharacterized protein LOC135146499 [Zophobas morio]|uniref:uncharacterized protein LOC135146499 n=1 Tax=Zophobas morio TaxID=2755281 RepID=UPI003083792B
MSYQEPGAPVTYSRILQVSGTSQLFSVLRAKLSHGTPRAQAHFCNNKFQNIISMEKLTTQEQNNVKVRDHNHLTGMYRGAAHQSCNLNYKDICVIPVVFHNMSGYDAHFFVKELSNSIKGDIKLLPINKERYISFTKFVDDTKVSLRFIDTFRFMPYSLDKLSSNLDNSQKIITQTNCNNMEEFYLLNRKGVFPYDYINSWEKLLETKLPEKKDFYSRLYEQDIKDEDYSHAIKVWNTFNIRTLGEYSDLYLKTDVLLLSDVFEAFRTTCLNTYQLDPLHYYTAPGLTFDAMLKTTKIKLELLTDIDKVLFVERGIRGGVSQCSNRYGKANNKYMNKDEYDPSQDSTYLMYFDVNNLYGAAMSQCLPYGKFEFVENFNISDILDTSDNSTTGYIIECDLDYPVDLHEIHSDLPLAPEHMIPPISRSKLKKLLLTLYPKKNYVIHYRNLKMYIKFGMKIKCVHRVLKFEQSAWLKEYIDLNTRLRQQAKNDFEKDFFKLMINAIYGKCMENVRKHRDIRLVSKWEGRWGVRSLISKPNFHSSVVFDDDSAIIEMNISKTFLYEFHYGYIKETFNNNAKLLYTDTDSLIYEFHVGDIYEYIKKDSHRFDTSDYDLYNVYGIEQKNKKVPGLMKDENNVYKSFIYKLLSDHRWQNLGDIFYPVENIQKNYRRIEQCVDEFMCRAAYLANHKALTTFFEALTIINYDSFTSKPSENQEHKRIFTWLKKNIVKGEANPELPLGWTEGPDEM